MSAHYAKNQNTTVRKTGKRGFTLIELLVVIAIIGILASVVLASLNSARGAARDAKRIAELRQLVGALELYANANNNQYPCRRTSAACITTTPTASNAIEVIASAGNTANTAMSNNFRSDLSQYFAFPTPPVDQNINMINNSAVLMYQVNADRRGYTLRMVREDRTACRFDNGGNFWGGAVPCF